MRPAQLIPAAAAVLALAALSACADDEEARSDPGSAAGSGEAMTSSSSPTSRTPLPPVVSITPAPSADRDPSTLPGPYVASATWADSDYGRTLEVAPTPAGRRTQGVPDAAAAWREVLALVPAADTPGMWEQFDCHWTWARLVEPDKPTWNVEPWRPVVDESTMIAERCNPGGPEV